jgi:hypothetical protein
MLKSRYRRMNLHEPGVLLSWPGLARPSTNILRSFSVSLGGRIKCGRDSMGDYERYAIVLATGAYGIWA